jgi:hypothetical protein
VGKEKRLPKWSSEELKAGYYRNRPKEDSEGGLPAETDSLRAIRNEKFGRMSKDTQDQIKNNVERAFHRATLRTRADIMRGDRTATLGRTLGRMQANQDSTMFDKPDGYAYGGRVRSKEAHVKKMEKMEKKGKSEKPEGYFLGGMARGLRKAVGGAVGTAGALLGRRRSRPAPAMGTPPSPEAFNKLRSRLPGGMNKLVGQFRRPAAPAPTAAPAAGTANQVAPPTQKPPAFKYGGVVPSKKAAMKDRDEKKWVDSVRKKAGGGKKGC